MNDFLMTFGTASAGVAACIALIYNAYVQRYGKKPHMVMYIAIEEKTASLVVANTGTAPAKIENIRSDERWINLDSVLGTNMLMYLKDLIVLPGQEFRFSFMRDILKMRLWDFYKNESNYESPYLLTATLFYRTLAPTLLRKVHSQFFQINITSAFMQTGQILEIVPQENLDTFVRAFSASLEIPLLPKQSNGEDS